MAARAVLLLGAGQEAAWPGVDVRTTVTQTTVAATHNTTKAATAGSGLRLRYRDGPRPPEPFATATRASSRLFASSASRLGGYRPP